MLSKQTKLRILTNKARRQHMAWEHERTALIRKINRAAQERFLFETATTGFTAEARAEHDAAIAQYQLLIKLNRLEFREFQKTFQFPADILERR